MWLQSLFAIPQLVCFFPGAIASHPPAHEQAPLRAPKTMASNQVITDALPSHKNIQIFTSLIRDVDQMSKLLSTPGHNFTVLAPTNSAMTSLPHKPWENPEDYEKLGANAYEGSSGNARAKQNVQRFVEAHVLPKAPWPENDKLAIEASKTDLPTETEKKVIWWERSGDSGRVIAPDGIQVEGVASRVSNGEIWIVNAPLML